MEVLLRNYDGKTLVWKEATYKNSVWLIDGCKVFETDIVAVQNDTRNEYVTCKNCGQTFRKGSQELYDHTHKEWTPEMCFECSSLRVFSREEVSKSFHTDEDNKWIRDLSEKVDLTCSQSYSHPYIGSQKARQCCKHAGCTEDNIQEVNDFFTEYPGAFDDMITVDQLIAMKCKRVGERSFKVRAKKRIIAYIDSHNIVSHFYVSARRYTWNLVYSKKYNKLFNFYGQKYEEFAGGYPLSEEEFNYIKEKIAGLYQ